MKEYEFHLSNNIFINVRVCKRDSKEKEIEACKELLRKEGINIDRYIDIDVHVREINV